jgi:hypothetical protein
MRPKRKEERERERHGARDMKERRGGHRCLSPLFYSKYCNGERERGGEREREREREERGTNGKL